MPTDLLDVRVVRFTKAAKSGRRPLRGTHARSDTGQSSRQGRYCATRPAPCEEEQVDIGNGQLIPEPFGPLQGVKILSTGTLIAQPYAAHLAAAFGAQVIQIEHPCGTTDPWRRLDDRMRGTGPVEV